MPRSTGVLIITSKGRDAPSAVRTREEQLRDHRLEVGRELGADHLLLIGWEGVDDSIDRARLRPWCAA
jgi:hypothetical protein